MSVPFSYPGGKSRIAPWIISNMPSTNHYVEPFFGSGAVFFEREAVKNEAINDLDGNIVNFFRCLRDNTEELIDVCSLTPYSREEFIACREPSEDPIESARRFWVRATQSMTPHAYYGWRAAFRGGGHRVNPLRSATSKFPGFADRLLNTIIDCRDALDVIESHNKPHILIYCDPPYHLDTRTDNLYNEDSFDHKDFLSLLAGHKAKIIISGYSNSLYDRVLRNWKKVYLDVTRSMGKSTHKVEVLYMNYDVNSHLEKRGGLYLGDSYISF